MPCSGSIRAIVPLPSGGPHMSNLLAVVLLGLHTIPVQLHTGMAASHPVTLLPAAKASQFLMAHRCARRAATAEGAGGGDGSVARAALPRGSADGSLAARCRRLSRTLTFLLSKLDLGVSGRHQGQEQACTQAEERHSQHRRRRQWRRHIPHHSAARPCACSQIPASIARLWLLLRGKLAWEARRPDRHTS